MTTIIIIGLWCAASLILGFAMCRIACLIKAGRECHEQAVGKGWPRGDGGTQV